MTNTTYLEWLANEDAKRIAEINGDAPAGTQPIRYGVGKYRLRCLIHDLRRRADELEKLHDSISDDTGADMGLFELADMGLFELADMGLFELVVAAER